MNAEGGESNTGVHASLHNLWTSRWTQAGRHVETAGDDPGDVGPFPLRHLRLSRPPVVDGRKSTRKFEPYLTCRSSRRVAPPGAPADAEPDRSGLAGVGPRLRGAPAGGFGARKPESVHIVAVAPADAARGAGPQSDAPRGRYDPREGALVQPGTTSMVSSVVTSGCTRTVTVCWPVVLTLAGRSMRRRSSSGPPAALTAAATSAVVTRPNSRPPAPARAGTRTVSPDRRPATACASSSERTSRVARARRSDSTCFS